MIDRKRHAHDSLPFVSEESLWAVRDSEDARADDQFGRYCAKAALTYAVAYDDLFFLSHVLELIREERLSGGPGVRIGHAFTQHIRAALLGAAAPGR